MVAEADYLLHLPPTAMKAETCNETTGGVRSDK